MYSDGTRLYVADEHNQRVLLYTARPVISGVKFNDAPYVSGDIIDPSPTLKMVLTDPAGFGGIDINNFKITVDSASPYTYSSFDDSTDSYDASTGLVTFKIKNALPAGSHNFKIEVNDYLANWTAYNADNLLINDPAGAAQIIGTPLNYPNPFKPSSGTTKLTYYMTVDANTSLYIFDMKASLIWKRDFSSGSMGGKAGYNEVVWDGKNDFNESVAENVYPFMVVIGGKIAGRGKIAVIE
jgi:archaellin